MCSLDLLVAFSTFIVYPYKLSSNRVTDTKPLPAYKSSTLFSELWFQQEILSTIFTTRHVYMWHKEWSNILDTYKEVMKPRKVGIDRIRYFLSSLLPALTRLPWQIVLVSPRTVFSALWWHVNEWVEFYYNLKSPMLNVTNTLLKLEW